MTKKKIVRINLDTFNYKFETIQDIYLNLGGRGLGSNIISEEVPPQCDPLGKDNKLVIAAGLLAGTAIPNSGRLSIVAKSPLTQTIKEANAGGTAAQKLARLGIQALVLEGIASRQTIIKITNDKITFTGSDKLASVMIGDCISRLRSEHGDNIGIICIGPAGEMQLSTAAIAVTTPDFYPRVAARGGLGAVMGAKNIKAIIIDDKDGKAPQIKDKELFKKSLKNFTNGLLSHPLAQGFKLFGTPVLVGLVNEIGGMPTKNYSKGRFEGAEKLSGERIAEIMNTRPNANPSHRCMNGCIFSCSNIYTDEKGEFVVAGLEYETLALMGSNCCIDDIDLIAKMNSVCNEIGVDTMDIGAAIAIAMEAGVLEWGDGEAALKLVQEIVSGSERGRMIGSGCRFTGETLGIKRIPHVKGQALSGYDPRCLKGTGVTYATSPMGADHTCGNALPNPANPSYDHTSSTGQAPVSQFLQSYFAAIDTLGLCLFASLPALDMPDVKKALIECVSAVLDESVDEEYMERLGLMILQTEKKFNNAVGFNKSDDRLPEFFISELLPEIRQRFDVSEEEIDSVNPL